MNVDCHPRPIGEDASSASLITRMYMSPCLSSFSTNSGYAACILKYTEWLNTMGVSPPLAGSTSQKKNTFDGNSGTWHGVHQKTTKHRLFSIHTITVCIFEQKSLPWFLCYMNDSTAKGKKSKNQKNVHNVHVPEKQVV
jgi:hypothetical protein